MRDTKFLTMIWETVDDGKNYLENIVVYNVDVDRSTIYNIGTKAEVLGGEPYTSIDYAHKELKSKVENNVWSRYHTNYCLEVSLFSTVCQSWRKSVFSLKNFMTEMMMVDMPVRLLQWMRKLINKLFWRKYLVH